MKFSIVNIQLQLPQLQFKFWKLNSQLLQNFKIFQNDYIESLHNYRVEFKPSHLHCQNVQYDEKQYAKVRQIKKSEDSVEYAVVLIIIIKQMLSYPPNNIQILVTKLLIDQKYKIAIKDGLQKYHVRQYNVQNLTPEEIFKMHTLLEDKFYHRGQTKNQSWCENELRIFIWLLLGYSFLEQRCISLMTQQDWQHFSSIFNNRDTDSFQFQALSILKKSYKLIIKWEPEEIELLSSIIKSSSKVNKWNQIGKKLYVLSNKKYFRTGKQCREYWINHLDPVPKKCEWSLSQDLELIKAIKILGKKWAKVSKKLQGTRTEHMVKNRYKTLCQNEMKLISRKNYLPSTEQELIEEIEKRIRSALQTGNHKMNIKLMQGSVSARNQKNKFQSADDEKYVQVQDSIQQFLEQPQSFLNSFKNCQLRLSLETMESIDRSSNLEIIHCNKIDDLSHLKNEEFSLLFNQFNDTH